MRHYAFLLLLLLTLFFPGCDRSGSAKIESTHVGTIVIELLDREFPVFSISTEATQYNCPTLEWLENFTPKLAPYSTEDNDCVELSFTAMVQARSQNRVKGVNLAFGVIYLEIPHYLNGIPKSRHATNIVRTRDRGWILYEPQTRKMISLDKALKEKKISNIRLIII